MGFHFSAALDRWVSDFQSGLPNMEDTWHDMKNNRDRHPGRAAQTRQMFDWTAERDVDNTNGADRVMSL